MAFGIPDYFDVESCTNKNKRATINEVDLNIFMDDDIVVELFKEKIKSMDLEKRKIYFDKIGINLLDSKKVDEKLKKGIFNLSDVYSNASYDTQQHFIAELLSIFWNDNKHPMKLSEWNEYNYKIINCVYPVIDFNKLLDFFTTREEKINFLVKCRDMLYKYIENNNENSMVKK